MKTIIVDLDGTLSCGKHRLHLLPPVELRGDCSAWDEFNLAAGADAPILPTIRILRSLIKDYRIVILTGRSDVAKSITETWLKAHKVPHHELIMRKQDDHRKDIEVKEEVLRNIGLENIECAYDDLEHVVKHMRSLGITTYQVTHYDESVDEYAKANKEQQEKANEQNPDS